MPSARPRRGAGRDSTPECGGSQKWQTGRMALHREPVDLGSIVEWAASVVRPLIEKKQLALEIKLDEHLPAVECDRTRISQVIINLLSNSARFTDAGRISVLAKREGDHVLISVADTGPGISAEDARVIFEPFSQGSGGRSRGGSGLGLTISKQYESVANNGGEVRLPVALG